MSPHTPHTTHSNTPQHTTTHHNKPQYTTTHHNHNDTQQHTTTQHRRRHSTEAKRREEEMKETKRDTNEEREQGKREERDWRRNRKGLRVGREQHWHESFNHVTYSMSRATALNITVYIKIFFKYTCAHMHLHVRTMMCTVRSLGPSTMVLRFLFL